MFLNQSNILYMVSMIELTFAWFSLGIGLNLSYQAADAFNWNVVKAPNGTDNVKRMHLSHGRFED